MDIQNTLTELRAKRGFAAAQLAAAVGVSRQTIYAMEAGSYVPNTLVALKLAQVLEVKVEEIFRLKELKSRPVQTAEVELLPWIPQAWSAQPGQPLHVCRVGSRFIAVPAESSAWGVPAADALVVGVVPNASKVKVQFLGEDYKTEKRLLLAGCDPSAPVLARHLQPQGLGLVVAYENSHRALELLKRGLIHVAGIHLAEDGPAMIRKMFGRQPLEIIRYAVWEEGIVVAAGNPKTIQGIGDLARPDVSIANREPGAGCRLLLDSALKRAGIGVKSVKGYEHIALGHLPAARRVRDGEADCCISTRAASRALGLDFVPLVSKPYELVLRKSQTQLPQFETLLEVLGQAAFQRELEAVWGYDVKNTGTRFRPSERAASVG